MSRVFVLQPVSTRDVSDATRFGELEQIFEENEAEILLWNPNAIDFFTRRLRIRLKDFNNEDYLLLMGDPSVIGVAAAVASAVNRGRYKCLKWDRRRLEYFAIQVDVSALTSGVKV